jgi:SAM-dependent methyltransferase
MVGELRRKAAGQSVRVMAGEGARLPFPRRVFDAVVLARVLYVMADWQAVLREAHEALRPGGYILHEWGIGDAREAWVHVRERLRTLFQEAGVEQPFHPGARTEAAFSGGQRVNWVGQADRIAGNALIKDRISLS